MAVDLGLRDEEDANATSRRDFGEGGEGRQSLA